MRKRVKAFIGDGFDVNELRLPLLGLLPLAVDSLVANLKEHDVQTTLAYLKGMGIFLDKNESLEDLADAIRSRGHDAANVTVNVYNDLPESEQQQKLRNLGRIGDRLGNRFRPCPN